MAFIKAKNLKHSFVRRDENGEIVSETLALDGVDLEVEPGQFIAVLGHNGSGKSTFARHLNVLLSPTEGSLWVDGKDVKDEDKLWEIRQSAGMIFQNPDNQIVAGVVEEDVAFGPENIGVPTDEIWKRVEESLQAVGMTEYRYHSPNKLSGGQKQRVAVAGVVAMHPRCIVMDEPTAMLDPSGRQEVLKTAHRLNQEEGVTVILITHYMEEVADADYVFVMDRGHVVMRGTPREIFSRVRDLEEYGLDVPQITRLAYELRQEGYALPEGVLNRKELEEELEKMLPLPDKAAFMTTDSGATGSGCEKMETTESCHEKAETTESCYEKTETTESCYGKMEKPGIRKASGDKKIKIRLDDVSYVYSPKTVYAMYALTNVSLDIYEGEFLGIIGHTGSGKSTLIQLLDGLLRATSGKILYEDQNIYDAGFSMLKLRGQVGLVFQYPEYQLFETTVLRDVAFGPKNQGLSEKEAFQKAKEALEKVRLPEKCWDMSPFELSGGQKRRAAIAGVIAMEPSVLVLDEPTAGLDPQGRNELFSLIREIHEQHHMTVLLVSHSMEDVADYVDRIVVMNHGEVMLDGSPAEVFSHVKELENASLAVPQVTYLMTELRKKGYPVSASVTTIAQAKEEIERLC